MILFKHPEIVTYIGEPINDIDTFCLLPEYLKSVLKEMNGFSVRNNTYHIRGCVHFPDWHSLNEVWKGKTRLSNLFDSIKDDDIPIAQDCTGNQFIIRQDKMFMLDVETGNIVDWEMDFPEFLNQITELCYDELTDDNFNGLELEPGYVFSFYPTNDQELDFSLKPFNALNYLRLQSQITKMGFMNMNIGN